MPSIVAWQSMVNRCIRALLMLKPDVLQVNARNPVTLPAGSEQRVLGAAPMAQVSAAGFDWLPHQPPAVPVPASSCLGFPARRREKRG